MVTFHFLYKYNLITNKFLYKKQFATIVFTVCFSRFAHRNVPIHAHRLRNVIALDLCTRVTILFLNIYLILCNNTIMHTHNSARETL